MAALAINWTDLLDTALQQTIQRLHLDCPGASRQERQDFLVRLGITPAMCLGLPSAAAPAAPPPVRPQIQLQRQAADESTLAYLARAEAFLRTLGLPDGQAVLLLQNAGLPPVAEAISAHIGARPAITLGALLLALREEFQLPKSSAYRAIVAMRPGAAEPITAFGQRLLARYMEYVGRPATDFPGLESVLVHSLVPILADALPARPAQLLQQAFDTGTRTWSDLCLHANAAMGAARATGAAPVRANLPDQCRLHPRLRHTNAACRAQRATSANAVSDTVPPQTQTRRTTRFGRLWCDNHGHGGHATAQCYRNQPTAFPSGPAQRVAATDYNDSDEGNGAALVADGTH